MTQDEKTHSAKPQQPEGPKGSQNRLVLIAVLAVVVVVTFLLVKQNMEPPPASQQAQAPAAGQDAKPKNSAELMQERMQQIAHIEDILSKDSTNFEAWSAIGNLYYDANMPDEAIRHYTKALELRPHDLHVQTDMATMLRVQGKSEDAVAMLNDITSTDSTFTQAWFNLGVIHTFDLKQPTDAIRAWERYLTLDPNSPNKDAVLKELTKLKAEL